MKRELVDEYMEQYGSNIVVYMTQCYDGVKLMTETITGNMICTEK